jgi:hypothetical protein
MWPGTLIGIVIAPFLFGTSVLYGLAFGWEMLYIAFRVDIHAAETPMVANAELLRVPLSLQGRRHMRHSLHEFEEVRELSAAWIINLSA